MSKTETTGDDPSWGDIEWLIARAGDEGVIARRVREWREARKPPWSQQQLADEFSAYAKSLGRPVALSKPSVVRLEQGKRKVTTTEAVILARLFGRSLAELLLPARWREQLEGLRLFDQAVRRLDEVQDVVDAYAAALNRVREVMGPELRERIALEATKSAKRTEAVEAAARDEYERSVVAWRALKEPIISFEDFLATIDPMPIEVAARHALGPTGLDGRHWYVGWDHNAVLSREKAERSERSRVSNRAQEKGNAK